MGDDGVENMELLLTIRGSGTRYTMERLSKGKKAASIKHPFPKVLPEADIIKCHIYGEHPEFPEYLASIIPLATHIHTTQRDLDLVRETARERTLRTGRKEGWIEADINLWRDIFFDRPDDWELPPYTVHIIPRGGDSLKRLTERYA